MAERVEAIAAVAVKLVWRQSTGRSLSIFALTAVVQSSRYSPRPAARTRTGSATTRTRGASGRSSRSGSERFHRHRRAAGGCQRHVVVLLDDSLIVRIRACWRPRKILVRAAFEHGPPTAPWRQPVARHPHSGETGSWAASVVAGPPRPSIKCANGFRAGQVSSRGATRTGSAGAARRARHCPKAIRAHGACRRPGTTSHNAIPAAGDADRDQLGDAVEGAQRGQGTAVAAAASGAGRTCQRRASRACARCRRSSRASSAPCSLNNTTNGPNHAATSTSTSSANPAATNTHHQNRRPTRRH